jgi:hypothetical protein
MTFFFFFFKKIFFQSFFRKTSAGQIKSGHGPDLARGPEVPQAWFIGTDWSGPVPKAFVYRYSWDRKVAPCGTIQQ